MTVQSEHKIHAPGHQYLDQVSPRVARGNESSIITGRFFLFMTVMLGWRGKSSWFRRKSIVGYISLECFIQIIFLYILPWIEVYEKI